MSSCESIFAHLNDLVDAELAPEHREVVERHLESCLACRTEFEELKKLKVMASALPAEVSPERDLWPEIDRQIATHAPQKVGRRFQVLAVAATLLAAVAVSWMMLRSPQLVTQTAERADRPSDVVQVAYEPASVDSVREEYREARAALERVVQANRSALSPETLEVIENNLELIDQAISEIEQALADNPGTDALDRQLRLAYRQQIEVLRLAAHLAA